MELPLTIMDTALLYRGRMNLSSDDALRVCRGIVAHARRLGGTLVINWHDRSLAPERLWGWCYEQLLEELASNCRPWFATASEAVDWFRWRRSFRFVGHAAGELTIESAGNRSGGPAAVALIYRPRRGSPAGRGRASLRRRGAPDSVAVRTLISTPVDETRSDPAAVSQPDRQTKPSPGPFVCMIAYTDYAIDARVRREAETLAAQGFRVRCLTTTKWRQPRALRAQWRRRPGAARSRSIAARARLPISARTCGSASLPRLACLRLAGQEGTRCRPRPQHSGLPRVRGPAAAPGGQQGRPRRARFGAGNLRDQIRWWRRSRGGCSASKRDSAPSLRTRSSASTTRSATRWSPEEFRDSKMFMSMNVPDPEHLRAVAGRFADGARGRRAPSISSTTARWPSGLAWTCSSMPLRGCENRVPGVRLHLWGNGDDLAAFQASGAGELGVEDRVMFRPEGYPLAGASRAPAHPWTSVSSAIVAARRAT